MKKTLFYLLFSFGYFATNSLYSQSVAFEWATGFGEMYSDYGNAITTDASGNSYTTGTFQETIDLDPGPGIYNLTSQGDADVFISKTDMNGNFLWAVSIGGISYDNSSSIALDASGNVCVMGVFKQTVDFNPQTGVYNLTSVGGSDVFVLKLDTNGNFLWAAGIGGTTEDTGKSTVLDASGNVFVTGNFQGTVDFDPGMGTNSVTSTAGSGDIFVLKLDIDGNFLWVKCFEGADQHTVTSSAVDASGNIYTTGYYTGAIDFDPGTGISYLLASVFETFMAKLDPDGNFIWVKAIEGNGLVLGKSIAIDGTGNSYTIGSFDGEIDFDPEAGTYNLTSISSGGYDLFISKWDENGDFVWAKNIGATSGHIVGESVATDASGNVYSTGYFFGTIDFNPGTGIKNLTAVANYDAFITRFDPNGNFIWAKALGGLNWDSGNDIAVDASENVYTTGYFGVGTTDFDPGAGIFNLTSVGSYDAFILKLEPCQPDSVTDSIISCGPYTWIDGITYSASTDTATFTLANSANCDSVITLNLTVIPLATSTVSETVCGPFTWTNGNGQTYATSTVATHTIPNGGANGCDSVVTLNLTVIVNTLVSVNGITLSSNQTGATYQWLDCDNANAPIPGATAQSFTPATNGNYAVEITVNGCTETSGCITVTTVGLESEEQNGLKIYPNPVLENLFIETPESVTIQFADISGKIIQTEQLTAGGNTISLSKLTAGVYFITSSSGTVLTFVKQ
ncbi:SBBP repeat-containing protein [Fluviicola sp.]|uniref:SBBP repeat-containing protein n=1 Tax=Fluviicola sp. TaxID=1917219 RepID=UPI0031CFFABB